MSHTALNSEAKALCFGLLAVGMWSTVATAFKIALEQLDVLQLLFIANLASVACLSLLITPQFRTFEPGWWKKHWRPSMMLALLNPILYYWVLFAAYDRLPAQIAQPINYTWALVLSFMAAWKFGHRLNRRDWIASCLGYLGVLILVIPNSQNSEASLSWIGVGLAIASTLLWATYWILNQGESRPALLALWQSFIIALPLSAGLMLWQSNWPSFSLKAWGAGFYVGAFEMGFAFAAWLVALKTTQHTSRISNLIFLSPIISLFLIHTILEEDIYSTTFYGLGLILCGLLIQQQGNNVAHYVRKSFFKLKQYLTPKSYQE